MFAELLWVDPDQLVAGGSSSLTMMHDVLVQHLLHGGVDSPRPWKDEEKVTFVCPVPGLRPALHDARVVRHRDGDRADARRRARTSPRSRRWSGTTRPSRACGSCRPTPTPPGRSSPRRSPAGWPRCRPPRPTSGSSGTTRTPSTTSPTDEAKSADILSLASAAGHPHRPIMFASTSKITYAGAGVAFLAASRETVAVVPGPPAVRVDRPGQGQPAAPRAALRLGRRVCATTCGEHRAILAPKFAAVDAALTAELDGPRASPSGPSPPAATS